MRYISVLAASAALLLPATLSAKPAFLSTIPNSGKLSCNTCHISTGPPSWNDFGMDVMANLQGGMPDWKAVCDIDSDGDGATNGQELQDSFCEWVSGANPGCSVLVTAPGDAASVPAAICGDGSCDEGEDAACCAADCDVEPPPPADEEESDAGSADDVVEEDLQPMEDVGPEEDAAPDDVAEEDVPPAQEDVPPAQEDVLPVEEDVATSDDTVGSTDANTSAPPLSSDTGSASTDTGTNEPAAGAEDSGCSASPSGPPVWMVLFGCLLSMALIRRREN